MKAAITVLIYSALVLALSPQNLPVKAGGMSTLPAQSQAPVTGHRRAPVLGADALLSDWPHPLIQAWQDEARGDEMAKALKEVGVRSLRLNFIGVYSPRGPEASAAVKAENKLPNQYPWFPISDYVNFIARHDFTTVLGINVEEGPEVASGVVEEFVKRGILSKLVAIELSNEPHLSHRPWLPEEYAQKAAAIIQVLTPYGVRFALPLTVGKEKNTPTKLSDSVWNRRMLETLSKLVDLKSRTDIYGVLHLYSRGVRAEAVDSFNKEVKPFAPNMRYLVTEFNIRLFLDGNPHLTNEYAREFALKLAEVMSKPDIEAMYVHAVPYHSILYWSDGRRIATVIGHKDPRLRPEDLTRGWHKTPAGKVYDLYSRLAWNGEVITYSGGSKQSYWAVKADGGRKVITLLNVDGKQVRKDVVVDGQKMRLTAPARSIVVFDDTGRIIEQLLLQ